MNINDQEAGYYIGIAYACKLLHEMMEALQEKGTDPYLIVETMLHSNAVLIDQCMQKLQDAGYNVTSEEQ